MEIAQDIPNLRVLRRIAGYFHEGEGGCGHA